MKMNLIIPITAALALAACSDTEYASNQPGIDHGALAYYEVEDSAQAYDIFFRPSQGWVGDPMPFYHDGEYHIFYLQDARDSKPTFHPIWGATTTGFTSWSDNGEMVPTGTVSDQDGAIGTGSFIEHDGTFYCFYTGHNGAMYPAEKLMLATSTDLENWTKDPSFLMEAPSSYYVNDFRDPFVYRDGDRFVMLVTARADWAGSWRGIVAQYHSTDLRNWELKDPFHHDPDVAIIECPDFFRWGDYEYLVYSNINDDDRKVHYRYRATGTADWLAPDHSALDGRGLYAAKTASDGTDRYLFGWCATRTSYNDDSEYSWGGSLVIHKLVQLADGKLAVDVPPTVDGYLSKESSIKVLQTSEAAVSGNNFTLTASEGVRAEVLLDRIRGPFKLTAHIDPGTSTRFGFDFGCAAPQLGVFSLIFDRDWGDMRLERLDDENVWVRTENIHKLTEDGAEGYDITMIVENSVCVLYINGRMAFSNRIYKMNRNPWKLFADNGTVKFENLKIHTK